MKALVLVLIALLVMVSSAYASVPSQITYQGRLTEPLSDNPVDDGPYGITFRIWADSSIGSNLLWTEVNTVTAEGGLFALILGTQNPIPDSVFDGGVRYLGIQIDGGGEIYPRTPLLTAPYAFRAAKSDSATTAVSVVDDAIGSSSIQSGAIQLSHIGQNGADSGSIMLWNGTEWSTEPMSAQAAWQRAGSVLETTEQVGLMRGNAGNSILGLFPEYMTNWGVACTTGSAGFGNSYSAIGGGYQNRASGGRSVIAGGELNISAGTYSSIVGGRRNVSGGDATTVGGGRENNAQGQSTGIFSGDSNLTSGSRSFIGGGSRNYAPGTLSLVTGGWKNTAGGTESVVSGGSQNSASAIWATIGGGYNNQITGQSGTIGGGEENLVTASELGTIGGGLNHRVAGDGGTVAGGIGNSANGFGSMVGGGLGNRVEGDYSYILGGRDNVIGTTGNWSYLFGIRDTLMQDSTFMVDMPHVRIGNETTGWELPTEDGTAGQVLTTNGAGQASWIDASGSGGNSNVPIGSVIAWMKSLAGTPDLPAGFVECNGQTISDAESPYDGLVVPDLNGQSRFLMGGATSGAVGGDSIHTHTVSNPVTGFAASDLSWFQGRMAHPASNISDMPPPQSTDAKNHLPMYMKVVWIMRVK